MAYLRLFGAQIAVGAAAIFARFALGGAGPLAVSGWRLLLAAIPFVALALWRRGGGARIGANREAALVVAGLLLAVHFATWIASLLYTSVALSTLLVCTAPLWTGGLDALTFRRAPRTSYYAGLALALIGLVTILAQREAPAPQPGHAAFGASLALCGGLALALYFWLVRVAGSSPRTGDALPTHAIVARTYSVAAVGLLVASAFAQQPPPAFGNLTAWGGIVAMAAISQGIGHTAMNAALRVFTPTVVALSTLLEPVIAAILAAMIFRETLAAAAGLGALAVLAGVGFALRGAPAPGVRPASSP